MRVLVACERSNTVRDAFIRAGHDAYSCDLARADHPNPNWRRHIREDARPLLREPWDLVIAHPPCTHLSLLSCSRWDGGFDMLPEDKLAAIREAALLFRDCLEANAPLVCVENPRQHAYAKELIGVEHSQEVQPYQFGHPYRKATRLWLRGLPKLVHTRVVESIINWVDDGKSRGVHRSPVERARTFDGIAAAMADQWGKLQ